MVTNGQHNNMCVISGMNWDNTSNAGVRAVNLNNNRGNSNNNVSFRADSISKECALMHRLEIQGYAVRHYAKSTSDSFLVGNIRRSGAAA